MSFIFASEESFHQSVRISRAPHYNCHNPDILALQASIDRMKEQKLQVRKLGAMFTGRAAMIDVEICRAQEALAALLAGR